MKTCSKCLLEKPLDEFYNSRKWKHGKCIPCHNAYTKEKKAQDPERYHNIDRKAWLKRKFGITIARYDEMLESQGGTCAICHSSDKGRKDRYFCVDHDHSTGLVRGLLCHPCNSGIGLLQDNAQLLRKAADYLDTHNKEAV
jgi:Recombination endonuclease VII